MIINIEQLDRELNISTIGEDGRVEFIKLNIPSHEMFNWKYATPANREDKIFKSWDNKPVTKTKARFLTQHRIQEILESQPEHIKKKLYSANEPNIFFIDIETEISEEGFPNPQLANEAVTAISFSYKDKIIALGTKKLTTEQINNIEKKINNHFKDYGSCEFNYIYFKSEYDMLYSFFAKAMEKMPVLTGWNFIGPGGFDWPYLYNRAMKLNIDPAISSPSRKLYSKDDIPMHKIIVDYMEIYKKWDRSVKVKENNGLDFTSSAVLGLEKIKYSGSLQQLYDTDFETYIFYNAVDARLVQLIHEKLRTLNTFLALGNITGIEANNAFSPIKMTEAVMVREFFRRGQVFPRVKLDKKSREKYAGGFVYEPIPGIYEWLTGFDFASLYPHIIMQWNISIENYFKNINANETYDENRYIKTKSGALFDNTKDSVFKTVLSTYYNQRKDHQKKMFEIEKEIEYLEELLK